MQPPRRPVLLSAQHDDVIVTVLWGELAATLAAVAPAAWLSARLLRRRGRGRPEPPE